MNNIRGRALLLLTAALLLGGCAGYRSSFSCPEGSGAACMPMDQIDRLIKNGGIEEYNEIVSGKKSKWCKSCGKRSGSSLRLNRPGLEINHVEDKGAKRG